MSKKRILTISDDLVSAPRDGTHILVYAKWSWDGDYSEEPYEWRVACYQDCHKEDEEGNDILSLICVSSNPYVDYAVDPISWAALPRGL